MKTEPSSVKQLLRRIKHTSPSPPAPPKLPSIDTQQLASKMRKKWVDPGYTSLEFSKNKALQGRILTGWEISRICLAKRSYLTPKDAQPYKCDTFSRQFPDVSLKSYSSAFQKRLETIKTQGMRTIHIENNPKIQLLQTMASKHKSRADFKPVYPRDALFGFGTIRYHKPKGNNSKKCKTIEV